MVPASLQYVGYRTIRRDVVKNNSHRRERVKSSFVSTPLRRLDDRIRQLCARVVASKDRDDLEIERILPELRAALHQSIERLRIRAVSILSGHPDFPPERRKTY
jgi:hypothetical protein